MSIMRGGIVNTARACWKNKSINHLQQSNNGRNASNTSTFWSASSLAVHSYHKNCLVCTRVYSTTGKPIRTDPIITSRDSLTGTSPHSSADPAHSTAEKTTPNLESTLSPSSQEHVSSTKSEYSNSNGFSSMLLSAAERPIYFDTQATTRMDPRVLEAMLPYFTVAYGNPHSRTHAFGWESEKAIEMARQNLAQLIHADPKEIIFTSGATESNNLAIKGVARFLKNSSTGGNKKKHIITTQTEHKCVLDSCRVMQSEGFKVSYLPVDTNGIIDMKQLEEAMTDETCLVSIMAINNEIGVEQPISEIGALCRSKKVYFHTDAAQAVGKIPLDVNKMNIDLLSISGHKFYGPKGIGALYVRRRPRVRLEPLISGGGQERGLRSGTLATPLIVGLGQAAEICKQEMEKDYEHISRLSKRLIDGLTTAIPHCIRNGHPTKSYPGCVNLSFAYVEGESLLMALRRFALSSGSACTSASLEPSYVLRALGAQEDMAHSSIRFGIGRFTTEEEIDDVIKNVHKDVERLREMSPLWEMVQEGVDLSTVKWSQH